MPWHNRRCRSGTWPRRGTYRPSGEATRRWRSPRATRTWRGSAYDSNARAMQGMIDAQRPVIERLRSQLALLESRYGDLLHNREAMLARYRAAKARERVQAVGEQVAESGAVYDPAEQLMAMERRIRAAEARMAARDELAQEQPGPAMLNQEGGDPEIEAELLQLKAAQAPVLPAEGEG